MFPYILSPSAYCHSFSGNKFRFCDGRRNHGKEKPFFSPVSFIAHSVITCVGQRSSCLSNVSAYATWQKHTVVQRILWQDTNLFQDKIIPLGFLLNFVPIQCKLFFCPNFMKPILFPFSGISSYSPLLCHLYTKIGSHLKKLISILLFR